jgi:hypothetical protein
MWSQYGRLAAKADPLNDGVTLHAIIPHTNLRVMGMGTHVARASFSEIAPDAMIPTLLSLDRSQTQKLVDDLHAAGFRPSTAAKLEEPLCTLLQQSTHYARRAGFFESALWLISQGHDGVDAKAAARRALVGVGE